MPIFECSRCNEMTYSAYPGPPLACGRCGNAIVRVIDGDFNEARHRPRDLRPGDHSSLVYDDAAPVAEFCARYLTEGVEAGERVVAALPGELDGSVRELLSAEVVDAVDWHGPGEIYGDVGPERVAEVYDAIIQSEDRTARFIAGPDGEYEMTADDLDHYERLAHGIVNARGAMAVCLFDRRLLPDEFIEVAERRHGLELVGGAARRNEQFEFVAD